MMNDGKDHEQSSLGNERSIKAVKKTNRHSRESGGGGKENFVRENVRRDGVYYKSFEKSRLHK